MEERPRGTSRTRMYVVYLFDCVAWRTSNLAKTIRREKNTTEHSIPSPGLEYAVCLSKSLVDLHGIITILYIRT